MRSERTGRLQLYCFSSRCACPPLTSARTQRPAHGTTPRASRFSAPEVACGSCKYLSRSCSSTHMSHMYVHVHVVQRFTLARPLDSCSEELQLLRVLEDSQSQPVLNEGKRHQHADVSLGLAIP